MNIGQLYQTILDRLRSYYTKTEVDSKLSVIASGGGAPSSASYLTAGSNALLSDERVATNTSTATWDLSGGLAKINVPLFAGTTPGLVPTSLNGTTKFLREDATWQVPAGGSSSDLALSKKAPAANLVVTAGYSAYVADELELPSGVEIEVGAGSTLEIG